MTSEPLGYRRERERTRRFFHCVAFAFRVIDRHLLADYREALAHLDLPPRLDVLDLGTGTGTLALALAERGHRVRGIDFVARLLRRARRRVPEGRFELLDLVDLPRLPTATADLVTLAYVLHGLSPGLRGLVLSQARRLSRRFVLVFDYDDGPGPWYIRLIERIEGPYFREFAQRSMADQLAAAGLTVVDRRKTSPFGAAWLARALGQGPDAEPTPRRP